MDVEHCQQVLRTAGVSFEAGLSATELRAAELRFGFTFPPDLAEFLAVGLPVGTGFPTWRHLDDDKLCGSFDWPYEGMCFDIEHNTFWPLQWGPRPHDLQHAFDIARGHIAAAPILIPIRGHRYLPASPSSAGNPVFSVYQTDIILYGVDLENYFQNEYHYFFGTPAYSLPTVPRKIDFWSWLVELNE